VPGIRAIVGIYPTGDVAAGAGVRGAEHLAHAGAERGGDLVRAEASAGKSTPQSRKSTLRLLLTPDLPGSAATHVRNVKRGSPLRDSGGGAGTFP